MLAREWFGLVVRIARACHRRRGRVLRLPPAPSRRRKPMPARIAASPQPDLAAGVSRRALSALRCRCRGRTAVRLRELRPHRNPGHRARCDAGDADGRRLSMLRQTLQGHAAPRPRAGSPFGENLRAFVIYLRSVQGIALARLVVVLRDLFMLEISEGRSSPSSTTVARPSPRRRTDQGAAAFGHGAGLP